MELLEQSQIDKNISDILYKLRRRNIIKISDVSDILKQAYSISNRFKTARTYSTAEIINLANYLGVDPMDLIYGNMDVIDEIAGK